MVAIEIIFNFLGSDFVRNLLILYFALEFSSRPFFPHFPQGLLDRLETMEEAIRHS